MAAGCISFIGLDKALEVELKKRVDIGFLTPVDRDEAAPWDSSQEEGPFREL
jgi:hypothetical protein